LADLATFAGLVERDSLCVVTSTRADGTVQASVVNAGVLPHPVGGTSVVAYVAGGDALKVRNVRARPATTVVARAGFEWVAVEGRADVIGPDDPHEAVDAEALRLLLREVFTAAGGTHDDWDAYDRTMADERRAVVLVTPERVYGVTR
jgi:PPOX class probable F420-dependent enzyme